VFFPAFLSEASWLNTEEDEKEALLLTTARSLAYLVKNRN